MDPSHSHHNRQIGCSELKWSLNRQCWPLFNLNIRTTWTDQTALSQISLFLKEQSDRGYTVLPLQHFYILHTSKLMFTSGCCRVHILKLKLTSSGRQIDLLNFSTKMGKPNCVILFRANMLLINS